MRTRPVCPSCGASFDALVLAVDFVPAVDFEEFAERLIDSVAAAHDRLDRITHQLEVLMSDQQHLDTDVEELRSAYAQVIEELKAQAANAGVAQHLDFTAADALVSAAQAEAVADAPATTMPPADAPPASATTDTPPVDEPPTSTTDAPTTPDSGTGSATS